MYERISFQSLENVFYWKENNKQLQENCHDILTVTCKEFGWIIYRWLKSTSAQNKIVLHELKEIFEDHVRFKALTEDFVVFYSSGFDRPNTFQDIAIDNSGIEKIVKSLSKLKHVTFFQFLDNSSLAGNCIGCQNDILKTFFKDEKVRLRIYPFDNKCNCQPLTISDHLPSERGSGKMLHLFNHACRSLYSAEQFSEIKLQCKLKENVFFLELTPSVPNHKERFEVMKIDSIGKIKKEVNNFHGLSSNHLSSHLYQVKGSSCFEGEFLGAIRSCAETRFNLRKFYFLPIRLIFFNPVLFEDLLEDFLEERISTSIGRIRNFGTFESDKDAFDVYLSKIMPPICQFDIKGLKGMQRISQGEIGRIDISDSYLLSRRWKAPEPKYGKSIICKILHIHPLEKTVFKIEIDNENSPNNATPSCEMIFEVNTDRGVSKIKGVLAPENKKWKESFHSNGIRENEIVTLSNIQMDGFIYDIFHQVCKQDHMIFFSDKIQEYQSNAKKQKNLLRRVIKKDKAYVNESRTDFHQRQNIASEQQNEFLSFLDTKTITIAQRQLHNPLNLFKQICEDKLKLFPEIVGFGHGDFHLDNVLLHFDKDKLLPNEIKGTFFLKDMKGADILIIDLAKFDHGYPISFDFVKLEVEIKNHIMPYFLLKSIEDDDQRISMIMDIEETLWGKKSGKIDDLSKELEIILSFLQKIRAECRRVYTDCFAKIAKKAPEAYSPQEVPDPDYLIAQQIYFYSLRTILYHRMGKAIMLRKKKNNMEVGIDPKYDCRNYFKEKFKDSEIFNKIVIPDFERNPTNLIPWKKIWAFLAAAISGELIRENPRNRNG